MKYLEGNTIKNDIIDKLIEQLYNHEDVKMYGCDAAYTLFEGYNVDGTITYSTYQAEEWIKEHFRELGEIVEEIKFQLGSENIPNIFDEPEKFMTVIYLEVASYLCGQCKTIEKNWDEEITLNNKIIKQLETELEKLKESEEA